MKKLIVPTLLGLSALTLLTGCVASLGSKSQTISPTIGQQLVDLQNAKSAGAISDAEYQTQKARLLNNK